MADHSALQALGKAPEMERGARGRFTAKKGRRTVLAEVAREILEQPEHIEELKAQARNGVGKGEHQLPPATHKLLVEYGYGLPPKRDDEKDEALQRMKALREAAREYLQSNPNEARVIDISAMRAAERLPAPKPDDDDERPAS